VAIHDGPGPLSSGPRVDGADPNVASCPLCLKKMVPAIPPHSFSVLDHLIYQRLGAHELLLMGLLMEALFPAPLARMKVALLLIVPTFPPPTFSFVNYLFYQLLRAQELLLPDLLMEPLAPLDPMTVTLVLVWYLGLPLVPGIFSVLCPSMVPLVRSFRAPIQVALVLVWLACTI